VKIPGQLEQAQIENLTADPSNLPDGRVWLNTASDKPKVAIDGAAKELLTADSTSTVTNKTIVAANNTVTTAASGNLAATELNAALAELQSDIDTRATSTALSDHLSDPTAAHAASSISFSPTGAVVATDVQGAIAELDSDLTAHVTDATDAHAASSISFTPAGTIAATTAQAAIAEVATDAAAALAAHEADTTAIHGIADTSLLVTTTGAQQLTNKDYDGGAASNSRRLTLPKDTLTNLSALSRKEATVVYATDQSRPYFDNGTTLQPIGSGSGSGGVNYITNSDAETDAIGYALFADGATLVDGTDGSPTATFARSTVTPLRGVASFLYTPGALGNGASYDFTIDEADKSKVLNISLDYALSATITEGNYQVYIFDRTNNVLIQPAPFRLSGTSGTTYKFNGTFQTSANSTLYRLIIWQAAATAVTLKLDNLTVGPGPTATVGVVTDWDSATVTGGWTNNTTYTAKRRRVGDNLEMQVRISLSGGGPNSASLTVNLPSGLTIDTAKLNSSNAGFTAVLGSATIKGGATGYKAYPVYNSTSSVLIAYQSAVTGAGSSVTQAAPFAFASGDYVETVFQVPILGWSSSAVISQAESSEGRVVAFKAVGATATLTSSLLKVTFLNVQRDDLVAYSAGSYVVKVPGAYKVTASLGISRTATVAGNSLQMAVRLNSVTQGLALLRDTSTEAQTRTINVSDLLTCVAGDIIEVFAAAEGTTPSINASNSFNYFSIERISGNQQVTAAETVAVRAHTSTTLITSVKVPIVFTTKEYDTHGSFNASTGVFTAPVSGKYLFTGQLGIPAPATCSVDDAFLMGVASGGNDLTISVFRFQTATPVTAVCTGSIVLNLLAGQQATIYAGKAGTVANTALGGTIGTHIEITRLGN